MIYYTYTYPWPQQNMGWTCPKCGICYAPHVIQCHACSPNNTYTTVTGATPYPGSSGVDPETGVSYSDVAKGQEEARRGEFATPDWIQQ